jgi:hypothetical protein
MLVVTKGYEYAKPPLGRMLAMIVLVENDGAFNGQRVHLRDRLRARVNGWSLDRDLARGASPESSLALALRARRIASPTTCRQLAKGVDRVRGIAEGQAQPRWLGASRRWPTWVRGAGSELRALSDRLLVDGPVTAQGIAKLRLLLSDGSGPLYQPRTQEQLRDQLADVLEALDPPAA